MKRHRWEDDACIDCGMTRRLELARSKRGCYGYHHFYRMIYRYANRQQAWSPGLGDRVPGPCRPPRLKEDSAR